MRLFGVFDNDKEYTADNVVFAVINVTVYG